VWSVQHRLLCCPDPSEYSLLLLPRAAKTARMLWGAPLLSGEAVQKCLAGRIGANHVENFHQSNSGFSAAWQQVDRDWTRPPVHQCDCQEHLQIIYNELNTTRAPLFEALQVLHGTSNRTQDARSCGRRWPLVHCTGAGLSALSSLWHMKMFHIFSALEQSQALCVSTRNSSFIVSVNKSLCWPDDRSSSGHIDILSHLRA
jgi:hypothetical protein